MNRSRSSRAFTLTELVLVIGIIALLLGIGVPVFSSAIRSSEEALAQNQLDVGLAQAREQSLRSGPGLGAGEGDAAAVFLYDPITQRTSIVACVQVGTMWDERNAGEGLAPPQGAGNRPNAVRRDVFVPAPGVPAVQMPRGWMVRGLAFPGTTDNSASGGPLRHGWYDVPGDGDAQSRRLVPNVANWVFPENGFYKRVDNPRSFDNGGDWAEFASAGRNRQTFMIRFRAGTGNIDTSDQRLVLVLDPAPSVVPRGNAFQTTGQEGAQWRVSAGAPFSDFRLDTAEDQARLVRQILARPSISFDDDETRLRLLGDISCDTILTRPVTDIALYNERRLVDAVGTGRLNPATNCIYAQTTGAGATGGVPPFPRIDTQTSFGGITPEEAQQRINEWIEGRYSPGGGADPVPTDARLYTVTPYQGRLKEILGFTTPE